jgi:hypothetical protein
VVRSSHWSPHRGTAPSLLLVAPIIIIVVIIVVVIVVIIIVVVVIIEVVILAVSVVIKIAVVENVVFDLIFFAPLGCISVVHRVLLSRFALHRGLARPSAHV